MKFWPILADARISSIELMTPDFAKLIGDGLSSYRLSLLHPGLEDYCTTFLAEELHSVASSC
jgi:hypothetical protein